MIRWWCSLPWNFLSHCHCYNSTVSFWISLGTSANHTIRYFWGNLRIVPAVFVELKPNALRRPVDIFISFSGDHNWMSFMESRTISIHDFGHQNRYSKAKPWCFSYPNQVFFVVPKLQQSISKAFSQYSNRNIQPKQTISCNIKKHSVLKCVVLQKHT